MSGHKKSPPDIVYPNTTSAISIIKARLLVLCIVISRAKFLDFFKPAVRLQSSVEYAF